MPKDYIDFEIHDSLNPKLWDGDTLKPDVRKQLLKIANEFHKYLNLDAKIKDIIITGSSSNYNYSDKFSDIDLHILYDFSAVLKEDSEDDIKNTEDLVKHYMLSRKSSWNDKFDIKVKGISVELYPQDIDEPHEANGQFSLIKNDWIKKPTKYSEEIEEEAAEEVANEIRDEIETAISKKASIEELEKLKEKVWDTRKSGLDSDDGEFSGENLAFKILRRDGTIEKLLNYINAEYGSSLSLNESHTGALRNKHETLKLYK